MDFKTPCQIFLGSLIVTLSIVVLGLVSDNIAYINNRGDSPMTIQYPMWNGTSQQEQQLDVNMEYLPSKFSMGTMWAMLSASIICALAGTAMVVASFKARSVKVLNTKFSGSKQQDRSFPYLPVSIILSAIGFIVSIAVAIYVWKPVAGGARPLQAFLPIPMRNVPVTYTSSIDFTPEVWNAFIAPFVASSSRSNRLEDLANEALAARALMIPIVVLSAALLLSYCWAWRQAGVAAANQQPEVKEVDVESVQETTKE